MAVYLQTKYDPKIHKPWLEKITGSEWWRIRSLNYLVGSQSLVGSYVDIAYSTSPEELILWADVNGVPVAKPRKL